MPLLLQYDLDDNGRIDKNEFVKMLDSLGAGVSAEEAAAAMEVRLRHLLRMQGNAAQPWPVLLCAATTVDIACLLDVSRRKPDSAQIVVTIEVVKHQYNALWYTHASQGLASAINACQPVHSLNCTCLVGDGLGQRWLCDF